MGLRFRKNVKSLPGKPDIVFLRARVAVFCDGDFWHGRNWERVSEKLKNGTNAEYWVAKIARNIERDTHNTQLLEQQGWHVIRVWETDINRDVIQIATAIKEVVDTRRKSNESRY